MSIMQMETLAEQVGQALLAQRRVLTTAESCTGGGIAYYITSVAGSSAWFDGGFVTYSNSAKQTLLGVEPDILRRDGAVSERTVLAMTGGALQRTLADVAIAVSGIAGPTGCSASKPVGTVFIAWEQRGKIASARRFQFNGDRKQVREQTIVQALQGVLSLLQGDEQI